MVSDDVRKVSDGVRGVSYGIRWLSDCVKKLSNGVRKLLDGVRNKVGKLLLEILRNTRLQTLVSKNLPRRLPLVLSPVS